MNRHDVSEDERNVLILFSRDKRNYRMRVARHHLHPGETDRFEESSTDMMGVVGWAKVPDGSHKVPSGEWLVRRALWHVIGGGAAVKALGVTIVDLGEI